jgi:hypothetical protein
MVYDDCSAPNENKMSYGPWRKANAAVKGSQHPEEHLQGVPQRPLASSSG